MCLHFFIFTLIFSFSFICLLLIVENAYTCTPLCANTSPHLQQKSIINLCSNYFLMPFLFLNIVQHKSKQAAMRGRIYNELLNWLIFFFSFLFAKYFSRIFLMMKEKSKMGRVLFDQLLEGLNWGQNIHFKNFQELKKKF